jgi:hypothetical protein
MPELTLAEAENMLRQDGRYGWLLSGRQAWSVQDVVREYEAATGVSVSHDTVTRWFKRLPDGGAENYGGTIGWRAQRDALVVFFASGKHLRRGDDTTEQVG